MDDFTLLKALQRELVQALADRKGALQARQKLVEAGKPWYDAPSICSKAKIHRLRLQIQELMLRIERKCGGGYGADKEDWYK